MVMLYDFKAVFPDRKPSGSEDAEKNLYRFFVHAKYCAVVLLLYSFSIIITRCVAMPSLMATRCMGQNSGPAFRHLWTKVHQIKFAYVGVSVV